jgi:hypothetical protein
MTFIQIIHINQVPSSQRRLSVFITKINRLMTFKDIMAVYCENYTKYVNIFCGKMQNFLTLQHMILVVTIFCSLVSFAFKIINRIIVYCE